jgi:hypothetical protein
MPEQKTDFAKRMLERKGLGDDAKSFTSERQHTAQAFNLHVERRDGTEAEGVGWSHYFTYKWSDEGDYERLAIIFGARAIEIEGRNLGPLVDEIREGKLNGVKELISRQATLLEHDNPNNDPIISSARFYPDFEEILKDIKGEQDDKTRHSRKFER